MLLWHRNPSFGAVQSIESSPDNADKCSITRARREVLTSLIG